MTLLVPWSPRAWGRTLYLTGAIPVWLVPPAVVAVPAYFTGDTLPGLVVVLLTVPVLTGIQRHRLRATAGLVVSPPPVRWRWLRYLWLRSTWRQAAYHILAAPVLAAAALAAFGMWLAGVLWTFVYVYAWTLHPGSLLDRGQSWPPAGWPFGALHIPVDAYLTLAGIALLAAAPWCTAAVGALDVKAARLLGTSRAQELQDRVETLTQTRAGVVDAADAERRRLERDLHDGTQQRLVSLAMRLGMARAHPADADQAQQVIAEAHEEAKAARSVDGYFDVASPCGGPTLITVDLPCAR
jgi:signal transduction histidine kinase